MSGAAPLGAGQGQAATADAQPATVLVTGAAGCLGAWTVKHLLEAGHRPVAFDLATDYRRLHALIGSEEVAEVTFVRGDLTEEAQVKSAVQEHGVERIVHLAALQVPFCRANPSLGAAVNVQGTVHVFEAARAAGIEHLAYASSIAVYGSASDYPPGLLPSDAPPLPRTLYGVTKVANEGTARIYWQDHGIASVALRPYTVYGVGRDQGVTSEPTVAMAAAARGESSTIDFGGSMQFQWASDVARQFIDAAFARLRGPAGGARAYNLGGPVVSVASVAAIIEKLRPGVSVAVGDAVLPFPEGFDGSALDAASRQVYQTPLEEGIRLTIERFAELQAV